MGNQSSVIFGFLIVGFFIFITLKGELPTYAGLLLLSPNTGTSGGTNTASNSAGTSSAVTNSIINGAIDALV